ncbi:hypothetical protein F5Y19DRAFT_317860 [Xylariaceae sp. FL1651]|nr:hypothetical protein F5Y19DRAFT_317860 [Xylariaceae sp. FL1651]
MMDDPWDWDVERVVQELCTPNRQWYPSAAPLKLPPLDRLETALRDHEVDGELLLTYDQAELCSELGIKVLKHKSTFKNAIQDMRLRSSQYRLYRKRQASEFDDAGAEMTDKAHKPDEIQNSHALGDKILPAESIEPSTAPHTEVPEAASVPFGNGLALIMDKLTPKRRRIAPTVITTEIDPNKNRYIITEADMLSSSSKPAAAESLDKNSDSTLRGVYLGDKSITRFDVTDSDPFAETGPVSEKDKQINVVFTSRLFPGRIIQTHRLMKRCLLRKEGYRRSLFKKPDIVPGANNPDHDEVLPLYGESDDDMEYDSDTWREIEEEKNEEPRRLTGLTADEIISTCERSIDEFVSEWREKKLPKYAGKANRIWNDARRFGLKDAIDKARQDLHEFEIRIAKLRENIERNEWRNVGELKPRLVSLEPSVFNREHRSWLIGVLMSPSEPAKISRQRVLREKVPEAQPTPADEEDEETLTSESEDDLNRFIVDDEPNIPMSIDNESPMDTGEERHSKHTKRPETGMNVVDDDDEYINRSETYTGSSEDRSISPKRMATPDPITVTRIPSKNLQTPSNQKESVIIDLTTPPDRTCRMISYKDGKLRCDISSRANEHPTSSPLIMTINDLTPAEQRIANELMITDQIFVNAIFSIARHTLPEDIWSDLILLNLERGLPKAPYNSHAKKDGLTAYTLLRLFEMYKDDALYKLSRYKSLDDKGRQRLQELYSMHPEEWEAFVKFLWRLSDRFEWTEAKVHRKEPEGSATSTAGEKKEKEADKASRLSDDSDILGDINTDAEGLPQPSSAKKKRKKVVRNREAAIVREIDQAGAVERNIRRTNLRNRLLTEGSMALGSQSGSIIINESKKDDQGFVYIHPEIAARIKDHQITGVRFMWDQIIDTKKRQGCLLAHTMGLGKTMQVITLLVAIGQASESTDPTISSQIPEELRESRTLILCPATLVNNWRDEMLSWLPEDHALGHLFKIDAMMTDPQRKDAIQTWGKQGGVMIVGYSLFKDFVEDEQTREILLQRPSIVVADEAHLMKNPKSKIHEATANFRTLSRVALTGSPLANNVEEYYSMINWVAPNYLSDAREFRLQYAIPIKEGLDVNSTSEQRRMALRMLRVLKSEVSPKVSRITIGVLKHDIPTKKEFVITVPLTPIQQKAYEMFIQHHLNGDTKVPVFAIHDLGLICASPSVFLNKLKDLRNQASTSTRRSETVTLPQQLISDEMTLLGNAERDPALDDFAISWKIPILLKILDESKKLGDLVLLFTHSKLTLDYLEKVLRRRKLSFVRLDGETPMGDRQGMVNGFNMGNVDIFLISTLAGGLGLNITGANRVIIFDSQFNPQNEQQAVGRAYRIGQKKPVFVYRFVCGGTFEQKMLSQAIWKMQLASRVVDKKHPIPKAQRFDGAWAMPEIPLQEDLNKHCGKDIVLDAILSEEKYREGIRAVEMMDTFEEEAVEDVELSADDRAEADRMILANEARRTGIPLAVPLGATNRLPTPGGQGFVTPGQPSLAGTFSGSQFMSQPSSSNGIARPNTARPNTAPVTLPNLNPNSLSNYPVGPTAEHFANGPHLPPAQIQGTAMHFRPPANPSNGIRANVDTDWKSLAAFEGELTRAFVINAGFPEEKIRVNVARDISTAIWQKVQYRHPDEQSDFKWAVMDAASSKRFVEALCMGIIPPQQFAEMTRESITQQLKAWKEMDEAQWEAQKIAWNQGRRSIDPETLQVGLRRMSSTPKVIENNQPGPLKSRQLDDQEALQAVLERRKAKTQNIDDREALQAVLTRRNTQPSQSSSSSSKEPRLPNWAKDVVRKARSPHLSSSVPPKSPPPGDFLLRPQPKTPFK